MIKILITGGTGFIGKNLIKFFNQCESYEIFSLCRKTSDIFSIKNYCKDICFIENDNEVCEFFNKNRFDIVIHLATNYVAENKFEQIEDIIFSNVTFGTKIAELSSNSGVKWFINTGTFWQFWNNSEIYYPANLYAATKKAFEDILIFYEKSYGLNYSTLMLNDTFGPGDTRRKIFNLWKDIQISGEFIDMSPGEQLMDITYIDNVISAYDKLIENILSGKINSGDVFAVYSKKRISLRELAVIYENITNKKLNINWGKRSYRKKEIMTPWNGAETVPGWEETVSLEEGIKRFINYKGEY